VKEEIMKDQGTKKTIGASSKPKNSLIGLYLLTRKLPQAQPKSA
jgi:hypothetical protein